jgi:hypothetical protein
MLEPFLHYTKDTPSKVRFRVYLEAYHLALSVPLAILTAIAVYSIVEYFRLPWIVGHICIGIFLIIFIYTSKALKRRSKRRAFNSKEELCKDPRAPILYLRPFHIDLPEFPSIVLPFIRTPREHLKQLSKGTPEENLTKLLRQLGPVIAVGTPGEKLPQLGAIRLYFNNEEWQEKVRALMTLSQLIVIQAGYSGGLEWELSLAKARLQPYRLLLSFLSWRTLSKKLRQREYETFKVLIERMYGISLPEQIGDALYLYFDHDWTPHLDYKGGYVDENLTRGLAARYGLKDINNAYNPLNLF